MCENKTSLFLSAGVKSLIESHSINTSRQGNSQRAGPLLSIRHERHAGRVQLPLVCNHNTSQLSLTDGHESLTLQAAL